MTGRHIAALAIAIAVSSDRADTQSRESPQRAQTSMPVSGVIVDVSGAPISRATVRLSEVRQSQSVDVRYYTETSDESGRFRFASVEPGRYLLECWSSGYPVIAHGAAFVGLRGVPITLAGGKPVDDLTITLRKGGAISGTVRDEFGDPISASVFARNALGYSAYGATDQHGRYRLPYLPPGIYIVGVEGSTGTPVTLLDSNGREQLVIRAAAWYGGGSNASGALPVRIAGDSDITGIDLLTRHVPAAPLVVTFQAPGALTVVQLEIRAEGESIASVPSPKAWDGKAYHFDGIAAGRYVMQASATVQREGGASERLRGRVEVTLDGFAPATVVMPLERGAQLTGRIVFDVTTPPTSGFLVPTLRAVAGNVRGIAEGITFRTVSQASAVRPDNLFGMTAIEPGDYVVLAPSMLTSSAGWMLTSVMMDGHEVVDVPIQLAANSVTAVILTVSDRFTELSGRVTDAEGRPLPGLTLVVFSTDRRHWYPGSRRLQQIQPDARGDYRLIGLPPGEYWLAAITGGLDLPNGLVAGLTELSTAAIRFSLAVGEQKRQDLRTGKGSGFFFPGGFLALSDRALTDWGR